MTRTAPRAAPMVLSLLLLSAGCLAGSPGDVPSATATPPTTERSTPTATPNGHEASMTQPDPDKEVRLANSWNRTVDVRVRVVRNATGETVHDESYDVAPARERTVFTLSEADPDGVETFTVVVTARNTTERVSIETNKCYGNAYAEILEDGTVHLYYAIC